MNKLVETLLIYIPSGLLLILAGAFLGGEIWAKGKIVLGDILKVFGWAGKNVRRLSIASEYQGTINSIIQEYNKNFASPIFPTCKIQWVTTKNQINILNENEAIICLSFNKKDHNLNFYNATLNFVQTGLIAKSKNYLNDTSRKAIDLLTTHIILRNYRKEVLTTFRNKFNEFEQETKSEFENLVPTNDRGLFLNLLLPELHYYGELIDTLPPSSEHNIEANGFLRWFKELATREIDDKSNLKYTSKNFKIGVILVGKDETWDKYGVTAYTKWADYYSSEGFNSVYVLGKGYKGFERAKAVINILTQSKGFDLLNKDPKIKCYSATGQLYIVTCYSLRPNKSTIAYLGWESLKLHFDGKEMVPAIVDNVQKESIVVNVFGLKFEVRNEFLSEIPISDARKTFKHEDELFLEIVDLDIDNQHIILSNKGTSTDPKFFIESIISNDKIYNCSIEKVQVDKQGIQVGLKVSKDELKSWIFIPRSKTTRSRFLDLNDKYVIGQKVEVVISSFNSTSSNFTGYINDLIDPWETQKIKNIKISSEIDVLVKQINEFSVTCEIEEGLECRFSQNEISWKHEECITSNFKIDESVKVKVLLIDEEKRLIIVSPKQIFKTPELEFYEGHFNKLVESEICEVIHDKGLVIKYGGSNTGYIPWFELGWGAVGRIENIFSVGEKITPLVADFDSNKNRILFSIKRKYKHQFDEWLDKVDVENFYEGKIISYFDKSTQVELMCSGLTVQAFILNKNVSNIAFIEQEDLLNYLPVGEIFNFKILGITHNRKTIELSRLDYLQSFDEPDFGVEYAAKYAKVTHLKSYFYSDELEGWAETPKESYTIGSLVNVIVVSQSTGEFVIVS